MGQLGLKSSRPLSQLGPVRFQSVRLRIWYMVFVFCTCITQTKLKINIKAVAIKLFIGRIGGGELAT